ncbi:MAG: fibronectin type III domain-containing protein [bacterium]|nr:fibronectin type III domain-containing protein [bacterium]
MDLAQNVSSNELVLENLNPDQLYYLRISPLNSLGDLI